MLTSVSDFVNLLWVDQQKWPLLCLLDEILTELPIPVLSESVSPSVPAWQCSCEIIDKNTVSVIPAMALQLYWNGQDPSDNELETSVSHWWHGPALRGTTSHKPVGGARRCFMLTLQYLQFEKPYFPVTQIWEAQTDLDTVLYPPGQTYPAPLVLKAVNEASGRQEDARCGHHPWVQNMLLGKGFL